jgi:hypothetical protein
LVLTANFITETLGDASSTGFGFNVGVIYNTLADIKGLSIGIANEKCWSSNAI